MYEAGGNFVGDTRRARSVLLVVVAGTDSCSRVVSIDLFVASARIVCPCLCLECSACQVGSTRKAPSCPELDLLASLPTKNLRRTQAKCR